MDFNPLTEKLYPPVIEEIGVDGYEYPNAEESKILLKSLKKYTSGNRDGSILTDDMRLGAGREIATIYRYVDDDLQTAGEIATNTIRVDWAIDPDGVEKTFLFWAVPWKGRDQLAQRIREYLREVIDAD